MSVAIASAPGKVILFGEHGVNRGQAALAGAVDRRVLCRAATRPDDIVTFAFEAHRQSVTRDGLLSFRQLIDGLRDAEDIDGLRHVTRDDFFAPARYTLGHLLEHLSHGLEIAWRSSLPIGSGLGSGAAASAAMVQAVAALGGLAVLEQQVAHLAWQGDVIAHGGIASGLDSGACALGGLTRYTVDHGPVPLPVRQQLTIVIGDTGVQADTADINGRVRHRLAAHPAYQHLFDEMGFLVQSALDALGAGDSLLLGRLMNLNQLLLEKLGVSSDEIETLIEAALSAGAVGAKLSGSGGGGIIIALAPRGAEGEVAAAIVAAGGRALVTPLGVPGVRLEGDAAWDAGATPATTAAPA